MPMLDVAREATFEAEFLTHEEAIVHMEKLEAHGPWISIDMTKPRGVYFGPNGMEPVGNWKVVAKKKVFGKEFRMYDPSLAYMCTGCPDCDGNGNLIEKDEEEENE